MPFARDCPGHTEVLREAISICLTTKRPCSKEKTLGTSLTVQWLGLRASTAGGVGSIPGWGTRIPHATWCGRRKEKGHLYGAARESHCHWDQNLDLAHVSGLLRKESCDMGAGNTTGVHPVISQLCGRILWTAARNLFLFLFSRLVFFFFFFQAYWMLNQFNFSFCRNPHTLTVIDWHLFGY